MSSLITKEQLASRLKESESILIATSQTSTVEQLTAGLGLAKILESLNKQVVFAYDKESPKNLDFLDLDEVLANDIGFLRDFIISCNKDLIDRFHYAQEDDAYQILLTPAFKKIISEEDMKYRRGDFNVDLVLTLDVANQSEINSTIGQYEQLMENIPMINITHRKGNINIDTWHEEDSSGGLGVMIYELSQYLKVAELTTQISNALLTSIIGCTDHFKNQQTQPQTMYVAGELLKFGASPQAISENLVDCELELTSGIVVDADETTLSQTQATSLTEEQTASTTKPKVRSRYISEKDLKENAITIGKTANNKEQTEDEHQLDEVQVDASGRLTVVEPKPALPKVPSADSSKQKSNPSFSSGVGMSQSPTANVNDQKFGDNQTSNLGQRVIQPLANSTQTSSPTRDPISGNNSAKTINLQPNINTQSATPPLAGNEIEGYELSNISPASIPQPNISAISSPSPLQQSPKQESTTSANPPPSPNQAMTMEHYYNQLPSTPSEPTNNSSASNPPLTPQAQSPYGQPLPPQALQGEDKQSNPRAPLDAPPLASMT
ncbi:MAG: hypothetical protein OXF49_02730 [Candidatus Saccharibacteria bacterium]|nr:hypothetical protein [Candidatus Saccharibacteria bacterium]